VTGLAVGLPGETVGEPVVAAEVDVSVVAADGLSVVVGTELTGLAVGLPDNVGATVVAAAVGAPDLVAAADGLSVVVRT
jgi:hypothetical protein